MSDNLDRRDMLKVSGGALASSCLQGDVSAASSADVAVSERGAVVAARAPAAAQAGLDLLTQGGNAIDAAVAAALCAAVVEPASCGIAGYGGHMTIGLADGRVTCIDANSAAPRAARPDMFSTNASGQVPGKSNYYGWLASGVPGTLAGLQLALDRYGNKRFADVAAPAIRFAAEGFTINQQLADSNSQGCRASRQRSSIQAALLQGTSAAAGRRHLSQPAARRIAGNASRTWVGRFLLLRRHRASDFGRIPTTRRHRYG